MTSVRRIHALSLLATLLTTGCATAPEPVQVGEHPPLMPALYCAWSMSQWSVFTDRVDAMTPSERIASYNTLLGRHAEEPSDLTSLQLAFLHTRLDPTMASLGYALSLLDQVDSRAEYRALADSLRREIVLLAAMTHRYDHEEQEARTASSENQEIQQLRDQVERLEGQLNKRLQQLETLKSIESEMVPGEWDEGES